MSNNIKVKVKMGMLINGEWSEVDKTIVNGQYVRANSVIAQPISDNMIQSIADEPGRFHLIASWSCPWSHRTMLVRALKGLQDLIPLHIAGGRRVQGYPMDYGELWEVPGTTRKIVHLHQLYCVSDNQFSGRVTVPVLWDKVAKKIISNDSQNIMRALDRVETESWNVTRPESGFPATKPGSFSPEHLAREIETLNQFIYLHISNGVYQAGFAQSQAAYDEAIELVFAGLEKLEQKLAGRRFLLGQQITESDLQLFPALVRFDVVYFIHHFCSLKRLTDFPNLWAYARDIYSIPQVAQTIDWRAIQISNHLPKSNDELPIIRVMPENDWLKPSGRERIG
ncbi:glutathione S-transferase C-terminal domain-containing protein [Aliikangiella coralliicola]|uniref:Glutathione-dependent reductase n=1 Tax=Aliikangiella coralliicola TaxID=2592383 RepID=A0A545UHA4_9GAMM|nr:glutathione S-transferase C-terminal domain-containing protein [Aliikangiella coralliicola]TQV88851.1 glutathione-dependent reductase [Aliikangiella coralliicola]